MNNRGISLLTNEVAYIILLVLAIALTFAVVYKYQNNAGAWQDYYSKEIVRIINSGEAGDEISFDVQKGTEIAKKNGLDLQSGELFKFDSAKKEFCVLLSKGKQSCYSYFKDLTIVAEKQPIEFGVPGNILHFRIVTPSPASLGGKEK